MNIFTQAMRIPLSTALSKPFAIAKILNPDNDILRLVHKRATVNAPRVCKQLNGGRNDVQKFGYTQIPTTEITDAGYYLRYNHSKIQLVNVINDLKGSRFIFWRMSLGIKTKYTDNFIPRRLGNNLIVYRSEDCAYLVVAPKRLIFATHDSMVTYTEEFPSGCDAYLLSGNCETMAVTAAKYKNRGYLLLENEGLWRICFANNQLQYVPTVEDSPILEIIKHTTHKIRLSVNGTERTIRGNYTVDVEKIKTATVKTLVSPNGIYTKTRNLLGQLTDQQILKGQKVDSAR